MAYNIEEIKNLVTTGGGFAMSNMYRVLLPAQNQAKNLNLLCKAVNMPGRQILTNERIIGIGRQNVAYGFEKEQVSMTFNVLNDPFVRYYFQQWMELIVGNNNYQVGYYDDYAKNVVIQQLKKGVDQTTLNNLRTPKGRQTPQQKDISEGSSNSSYSVGDQVVYSCLLEDAFPVSVTGVGYSDAATDTPIEITVTFAYKNWRTTGASVGDEPAVAERAIQTKQLKNTNIGP